VKWLRIGASPSATVLAFVLAVFAAAGCTADETTQQSPAVRTATPNRAAAAVAYEKYLAGKQREGEKRES
jgi:hypothetical protein